MEFQNIQANVTVFVSLAIAVMLILIASFLLVFNISQRKKFQYHQNLVKLKEEQHHQLIKAAVRSEEAERHRISEELHDEVGALLAATRLYLYSIHPDNLKTEEKEILQKATELLGESIKKVRGISHNLHSGVMKEIGLNEAIRSFAQKLNQGGKLEITTHLDDLYNSSDTENDINVYRIVQELCGNIIKHSNATHLELTSKAEDHGLNLIIQHNGKGLTQEEFEKLRFGSHGLGLKNIQNRIILLKGKINFQRMKDKNIITLEVPVS